MQNFLQMGEVLKLTAPYTRTSGQGALVGGIFGVAKADVTSGDDGEFVVEGVCRLTKVGSQAWAIGDRIYWDDSNKHCSNVGTVGQFIGNAYETVGSGSGETLGAVRLCGCAPMLTGPQTAVADLAGTLTGTVDGTMVDVAATAGSCAGGSSPTASNVDTAIATAVASIVTGVNTQNKELLTKINALLAELRLAGILHS